MTTYTVHVTKKDIFDAWPSRSFPKIWPLANAVRRAVGSKDVFAGSDELRVDGKIVISNQEYSDWQWNLLEHAETPDDVKPYSFTFVM